MRVKGLLHIAAALCAVSLQPAPVAAGGDQGPPGDIFVTGSRVVDLRNTSGYLARYTTIPTTSYFAKTGGLGQPCTFQADSNGVTSDGQHYTIGQTVTSTRWIFEESDIVSFGDYWTFDPQVYHGPLKDAYRTFMVFCDNRNEFMRYALVYAPDSMINPHTRLTDLYNGLQLEQPTVWRNPVVDRWGGLITRYPAWLAINDGAWRPQPSNSQRWRGWLSGRGWRGWLRRRRRRCSPGRSHLCAPGGRVAYHRRQFYRRQRRRRRRSRRRRLRLRCGHGSLSGRLHHLHRERR